MESFVEVDTLSGHPDIITLCPTAGEGEVDRVEPEAPEPASPEDIAEPDEDALEKEEHAEDPPDDDDEPDGTDPEEPAPDV